MEKKPAPAPEELKFWDYIENPIGKVLLQVAVPSESDVLSYVLRLHNLDGFNRLVGLGAEIIAAGVGAEGMAEFVAKSDARFHDPYTGKPMVWDAGSRELSFKAGTKRMVFNVENGRVFLQM